MDAIDDKGQIKYQLKVAEPLPDFLQGQVEQKPKTPGEYFSLKFPEQTARYGPPVLEKVEMVNGTGRVTPLTLNDNFFASVLGGVREYGHHVVFFTPEQQFYFLDHRTGLFAPTTEQKLLCLLSQLLIHCAAAMPANVDIQELFVELRKDYNLFKIIRRAKALLAASESFFSETSHHKRVKGPETHQSLIRSFTRDFLRREEDEVVTVTQCFDRFKELCTERGVDVIERRMFTPIITEIIRELFQVNLRRDVIGPNGRYAAGWKHLAGVNTNN